MDPTRNMQEARLADIPERPNVRPERRPLLWLLEDSPLQAEQTLQVLAGYDVEHFSNGESLVERLGTSTPDLLILDWELPGMSGLDVLRFVRESRDEATLPALVLTGAQTDEPRLLAALAAGANDFVTKPFNAAALRARVQTLVRIRELYARARDAEAERTEALARVREVELRTQIALEAADVGTYELDARTGALGFDANARAKFGLEPDAEVELARVVDSAIHPEDRPAVREAIEASLDPARRAPFRREYRVIGLDGVERWLASYGEPFFEDERPVRLVGALLDVTERKRATEALEREAAFRELFIGILGHDLRTPLSSLRLLAQILPSGSTDEATRADVGRRIEGSARRMERMIADLLDFTRSRQGGGMPVTLADADLVAICRPIVDEVQTANPQRSIVFESHGDTRGSWDFDRLQQVASNLVTNALDYSSPATPVRVTVREVAGDVILEVHNACEAIDKSVLPYLFDPFRRASSASSSRRSRGLGLGLYIVAQIARAHGGEVTVRSTDREGTTFTLRLPRTPAGNHP